MKNKILKKTKYKVTSYFSDYEEYHSYSSYNNVIKLSNLSRSICGAIDLHTDNIKDDLKLYLGRGI